MRKQLTFAVCFLLISLALAGLLLYDWTRTATGQEAPESAVTFVDPYDMDDSELYL